MAAPPRPRSGRPASVAWSERLVQHPEKAAEMCGLMDAWFAKAGPDRQAMVAESEPLGKKNLERLRALGYVR